MKVQNKTLKIGDRAPSFIAKTYRGEITSLKKFRGKMVWLIFYRYPTCPLCNLHLNALKLRIEKYKADGLEIIAVFETGSEKFEKKTLSFLDKMTVVTDPMKVLYRLYQTDVKLTSVFRPTVALTFIKAVLSGFPQGTVDGQLGQVPASFLIAENGSIEQMYFGRNIADHIPFSKVEEFIQARSSGIWKAGARF